jgi:hypothetical protein
MVRLQAQTDGNTRPAAATKSFTILRPTQMVSTAIVNGAANCKQCHRRLIGSANPQILVSAVADNVGIQWCVRLFGVASNGRKRVTIAWGMILVDFPLSTLH